MLKKNIQREIDDAIELFESAHNITPTYDSETGTTGYSTNQRITYSSVVKLKRKREDYRPGPIKIYTAEEIDEYVKSKKLR